MLFTSQIILSGFSPWAQLPKAALSTFILRDWEAVKVGRAAQAENLPVLGSKSGTSSRVGSGITRARRQLRIAFLFLYSVRGGRTLFLAVCRDVVSL